MNDYIKLPVYKIKMFLKNQNAFRTKQYLDQILLFILKKYVLNENTIN